ncbi:MAG: hypothetical protein ACK49N_04895, partial [Verrucomicrobiota bacterium]
RNPRGGSRQIQLPQPAWPALYLGNDCSYCVGLIRCLVAGTQNHLIEGRHKALSTSHAKMEIGRKTTEFSLQIRQKSRKLALFACRVCGTRFICPARNAHADLKKMLDSSLRNAKHSPQRNATSTISGTRVANSGKSLNAFKTFYS